MTQQALKQRITSFITSRTQNALERVRLVVYICGCITQVVFWTLHLTGLTGMKDNVLYSFSVILLLANFTSLWLYLSKKVDLVMNIVCLAYLTQLIQSLRVVYLSIINPPNVLPLLIINQIGSYTILLYITICFVPRAPFYITAMSLISLAFAGFYDGGRLGLDLVSFMTIMTILTYIMSGFSQKAVNSLQQENTEYQDTLNGLLHSFHMTRQELIAYAQLSRNKKEDKHIINAFFSEMDKRAEHNIIKAVKIRMAEIDSEKIDLAKRYPDFTPTEIEVCKYIIEGNTQKDIARITGKSESNVSTVRGRIRKKLGLKPDDDLRTKLME